MVHTEKQTEYNHKEKNGIKKTILAFGKNQKIRRYEIKKFKGKNSAIQINEIQIRTSLVRTK